MVSIDKISSVKKCLKCLLFLSLIMEKISFFSGLSGRAIKKNNFFCGFTFGDMKGFGRADLDPDPTLERKNLYPTVKKIRSGSDQRKFTLDYFLLIHECDFSSDRNRIRNGPFF